MRSAFWQRFSIVVLSLASYAHAAAADPTSKDGAPVTLCLSAAEPDFKVPHASGRLLVREIARQAMLISARDELGLATRDMTLRETMPSTTTDRVQAINVSTAESADKFVRLRLTRGSGDEMTVLYEKEIPLPLASDKTVDYLGLVVAAEQLSRSEIVDALRTAGFHGEPNRADPMVTVPASVRKQLAEMNFFSQFAALRELHQLQRTKGESPETLAALVRAYAHLGQLTKFHWNASHKAFHARSLLYAQRLVEMEKKSPWSLKHRAYAASLAGLHATALADLKAASEPAGTDPDASPAEAAKENRFTPWEPLIMALCHYDAQALRKEPAESDLRQFAAFCRFLVVENSNCESLTLTTGSKALEEAPECYCICDSMARYTGVISRHKTTVQGPLVLGQTIALRLRQMLDLPKCVVESLDDLAPEIGELRSDPAWAGGEKRASLVKGLANVGAAGDDTMEPSWELLARLVEDVTLVHVYRRLEFFHDGLGFPAASYRDQLLPAYAAVGDHPYLPLVKTAVLNPQRDVQQIVALCESAKPIDVELSLYPIQRRANYASAARDSIRTRLWDAMWRHTDMVAEDLEQMAYYSQDRGLARQLFAVSPHSPQAIALLVLYDHEFSPPKMKEWEQDHSEQPVVSKALAIRYTQLGQFADAERCLKRYVELSPDQWGYQYLADVYWRQKQPDKWRESLDESLNYEDFALSHAQTQVKLARYFMEKKDWDQALPYADAAAQSGAAWAMMCAAECYESMEQWDESEQLIRATAERYTNSALDWYFWCRRTGHGDLEAARMLAKQYAPQLSLSPSSYDWDHLGVYHVLTGNNELARKSFARSFESSGNPYAALHLGLLADAAGDTEARDKAIMGAVDRGPQYQSPSGVQKATVEFAKWLNNVCHLPADATLNMEALDDILKTTDAGEQANLEYFAARYFQNHGHQDLARQFLEKCVATKTTKWNCTLASVLLRDLPASQPPAVAAPAEPTSEN
jgi:tetratricopeptide (TPR) repeat protein